MMAPNRDMISKSWSPTMHSRISVTAERQQKSQQQQKGQGCGVVYTITPMQEVMSLGECGERERGGRDKGGRERGRKG